MGSTIITVDTTVCIYALVDPRTDTVRYIGKAQDPEFRLRQHMEPGQLGRYRSHKNSWLKGLLADGFLPQLQILAEVSADQADYAERYWIGLYRWLGVPLTNGTAGGDGGAMPPEIAKAAGLKRRGQKRTEVTRARMSVSAKRRAASPAERERLRSISNRKPPVRFGTANNKAKLTDDQVREIRLLHADGMTGGALARMFDVTAANISSILIGKTRLQTGGPIRSSRKAP